MQRDKELGASLSGPGCSAEPEPISVVSAETASIPSAAELAAYHEHYGPCDGFGPLWTCSACTGLLGNGVARYPVITSGKVDETTAANAIGDFLLEKAERAALEAMGCCDGPAAVADYMRRALILDFPGQPWRHGDDLFHAALAHIGCDQFGSALPASAIEAGVVGDESAVPKADAHKGGTNG